MGRIVGAFGVKGWIRLQPITDEPASLLDYVSWWIEDEGGWKASKIEKSQLHGQEVVAKLAGCDDRDAAAHYRGRNIAIARSDFPAAGENEFYWADLVGLKVVNREGVDFGTISRIFETGANDVLVVEGDRERLIPFTEHVVHEVDLAGRVIRIDWGADY